MSPIDRVCHSKIVNGKKERVCRPLKDAERGKTNKETGVKPKEQTAVMVCYVKGNEADCNPAAIVSSTGLNGPAQYKIVEGKAEKLWKKSEGEKDCQTTEDSDLWFSPKTIFSPRNLWPKQDDWRIDCCDLNRDLDLFRNFRVEKEPSGINRYRDLFLNHSWFK